METRTVTRADMQFQQRDGKKEKYKNSRKKLHKNILKYIKIQKILKYT